jgi:muramoyltetrapeptide carboxypeptidase
MTYIRPKKLQKGDVIGIISPASSPENYNLLNAGIRYIENLGYRIELGKHIYKNRGYLAGTDEERVSDIHQMFQDKKVKAVFCLRGGYGAFRLLDKINYDLIKTNPKIFVGFSEITALQMAFLQRANLITFAGPMVIPNFSGDVSEYTEENFWQMITSTRKVNRSFLLGLNKFSNVYSGICQGNLIGGNLAVFVSLIGTKYMPKLMEKILLLEDIGESPYKIDRMLNQLKLHQTFKKINGIILGNFVACSESNPDIKTLTLDEVFNDYFNELKIPVIYNFPHGHVKDMLTLPIGVKIKLDTKKGFVEITESAVR